MERHQTIIVLIIIGGAIVTVLGAWWLSQRPESVTTPFEAAPLRAQPGTEREQTLQFDGPVATRPSGQEADPDSSAVFAEGAVTPGGGDAAAIEPDPMALIAAEALRNPSASLGLESISTALASATLAEASNLYAAAGALHLQQSPPNETAAIQAFEQAIDTAVAPPQAHQAAMHLAELFVFRGETAAALEVLSRVLPTTQAVTVPTRAAVRLRLFQGGLFEDAGDAAQARACFAEALHNARIIYLATDDEDAAAVYRQASLALARHHRHRGDHEAADDVLAQMRSTLSEN